MGPLSHSPREELVRREDSGTLRGSRAGTNGAIAGRKGWGQAVFRRVLMTALLLVLLVGSSAVAYAQAPRQSEDGTVTTLPPVEIDVPTSVVRGDDEPPVDVAGRQARNPDTGGDWQWALLAIPVALGVWVGWTLILRRRAQQTA
jgi:hypothetical protein